MGAVAWTNDSHCLSNRVFLLTRGHRLARGIYFSEILLQSLGNLEPLLSGEGGLLKGPHTDSLAIAHIAAQEGFHGSSLDWRQFVGVADHCGDGLLDFSSTGADLMHFPLFCHDWKPVLTVAASAPWVLEGSRQLEATFPWAVPCRMWRRAVSESVARGGRSASACRSGDLFDRQRYLGFTRIEALGPPAPPTAAEIAAARAGMEPYGVGLADLKGPPGSPYGNRTDYFDLYTNVYTLKVGRLKPIAWLGDSLSRLRESPAAVRATAGHQLELVQRGESPDDFRPMPDVGPGVVEIRLHGPTEYRVFYVAKFQEAVYVLHCFVKKTQATRKADIDIGKRRYAAIAEIRKGLRD